MPFISISNNSLCIGDFSASNNNISCPACAASINLVFFSSSSFVSSYFLFASSYFLFASSYLLFLIRYEVNENGIEFLNSSINFFVSILSIFIV